MKDFDSKSLAILEVVILVFIGFFSIDFLSRNYNEFQRICSQAWSNDAKQYQICMEPYFKQTNLDKYAIGVAIGTLVFVPILYFLKRKA